MSAYPATCLLGHRLNAFRLAYLTPAIYINIGGQWTGAAQGVLVESLAISDRLNDEANTLVATIRGTKPVEGGAIRLALGSQSAAPLFAGTMLRVTRVWGADNPAHLLYHVEATDPTWQVQSTLFSARYVNQSASAIAADLLTRAPAGVTGVIQAGLPVLDTFSLTNTTLMDAFVQLAKRIGGYTWCDYQARVHLCTTDDTQAAPRALRADHPSLAGVSYVRDLTQIITRAIVEGGGVNALTAVPATSTVLPVESVAWYAPGGGYVRSGTQRIAYAGLEPGGAGSFAGTGVTPTTAPAVVATVGTSPVAAGAYRYAYTWVTAVGETLPSPAGPVTLGAPAVPAPVDVAPIGNVTSGLVIGVTYSYLYAWSYVDSDTDVSQLSALQPDARSAVCEAWVTTSSLPAPTVAPTVNNYATGAIEAGAHSWAYTFCTATDESAPAPVKAWTLATLAPPTVATSFYMTNANNYVAEQPALGFVAGASVRYAMSVNAANRPPVAGDAVSGLGPASAPVTIVAGGGAGYVHEVILQTGGGSYNGFPFFYMSINGGPWYWANNGTGGGLVSVGGPHAEVPLLAPAPVGQVQLSAVAVGSASVTARKLYRTVAGGSELRLVTTITNNTATTAIDNVSDLALGPVAPAVGTSTRPGGITFAPYAGAWDPAAKRLLAFRLVNAVWRLLKALPVGHAWTAGSQRDVISDAAAIADPATYPANPAPGGSATLGRAVVGGVAPGPTGGVTVTARKVYRTGAGGSQLKFLATLADNTSTGLPGYDTTPDAGLGVNAPTADTAGLIQTSKLVPAGSTDLPVTSTGPFSDLGGYVLAGTQVIGYHGRTATALTGIPPSGENAIGTSIPWGTPITVAPALIGIPATGAGAIVWALLRGDPVNVVVIVDDVAAQQALAALLGGGDGVRESLLADGRIGLAEATARGRALLAANKSVRETVAYRSRDVNTRSGARVVVDLPAPTDVHGTYRVQEVGITRFHARGLVPPTYETRASSQQFTFEDWIRQLARTQAPPATGE